MTKLKRKKKEKGWKKILSACIRVYNEGATGKTPYN
jgi:hypothetical protein